MAEPVKFAVGWFVATLLIVGLFGSILKLVPDAIAIPLVLPSIGWFGWGRRNG